MARLPPPPLCLSLSRRRIVTYISRVSFWFGSSIGQVAFHFFLPIFPRIHYMYYTILVIIVIHPPVVIPVPPPFPCSHSRAISSSM